jgi:hypothetical protein
MELCLVGISHEVYAKYAMTVHDHSSGMPPNGGSLPLQIWSIIIWPARLRLGRAG